MDPQEFLRAQMEAQGWGGEVVGFYHSHPDAQATPSVYDSERAWGTYLYLIVPVSKGRAGQARLWQLESPGRPFSEMMLRISG
jgi:proteasome lid subunit RPN8/RPN11